MEIHRKGCTFPECVDGKRPSFCGNCGEHYDPRNDPKPKSLANLFCEIEREVKHARNS